MIRYVLLIGLLIAVVGCESKTEITAPGTFLPPTQSADAGGGGGDKGSKDTFGGQKEKFVP
jgi:hypothetical protein